jgi:hypothetical protein
VNQSDVTPVFARFDIEKSGVLDFQSFKASVKRLVLSLAPDIGFILQNEGGFDELKEELLYLAIANALLTDYEGSCPPFEALSAKLPLPYLLSTETDLCKKLEPQDIEKVYYCY